ncbi:hypothetical protein GIY62_15955 [Burkholderia plantarii]|uniref:Lipoprotein n=1 Tax=Burkholderia plantarii TaxID=41899 RepID=A0A0B6RQE2_BURPL|nr:hypothetical protein [Burkholderia plantarii]AJK45598.1 hypothetical protein BGL_1c10740 [Burkholderia plantarii]WLE58602.1 hypothetical protein GIY62_15955 [Burkholderia plantarii]
MQASGTRMAKCCAIALVVTMSVSGCTSFQPVVHEPAGDTAGTGGEANHTVRSTCSRLAIDLERDVKVGDEIRYHGCDGTAGSMKVETIGADTIGGGGAEIDVREMRSMEVKSVSVGRTVLFGVGVSAAVVVAAIVIFGATLAAAILGAQ